MKLRELERRPRPEEMWRVTQGGCTSRGCTEKATHRGGLCVKHFRMALPVVRAVLLVPDGQAERNAQAGAYRLFRERGTA